MNTFDNWVPNKLDEFTRVTGNIGCFVNFEERKYVASVGAYSLNSQMQLAYQHYQRVDDLIAVPVMKLTSAGIGTWASCGGHLRCGAYLAFTSVTPEFKAQMDHSRYWHKDNVSSHCSYKYVWNLDKPNPYDTDSMINWLSGIQELYEITRDLKNDFTEMKMYLSTEHDRVIEERK